MGGTGWLWGMAALLAADALSAAGQAQEAPPVDRPAERAEAEPPRGQAARGRRHRLAPEARPRRIARAPAPGTPGRVAAGAAQHGPAQLGPAQDSPARHGPAQGESGADHGPHTEHIFGFIEGADLHKPGETDLKFDFLGGFARRSGTYRAVGSKVEVHTGVVDGVNAAIGFLGDHHRVRSVPGLADVPARAAFSGASAELRLGLLRREQAGLGVTLRVEPSVSRFDDLTGRRANSYGAENALLVDAELVPGRLFAAANLFYDLDRTRERGALTTERGSSAGIGGALALQVAPGFFAGYEARYLRAYEGLGLNRYQADAVLVGPTLFATLTPRLTVTAAFSVRVAGGDVDPGGAGPGPGGEVEGRTAGNAVNFERYQGRLKLVYDF